MHGVMDEKGEASPLSSSSWWSTVTGDGDHWRRDDRRNNSSSMSTNDASRDNIRRITKRQTINNKMGIKTATMIKNRRASLEEYLSRWTLHQPKHMHPVNWMRYLLMAMSKNRRTSLEEYLSRWTMHRPKHTHLNEMVNWVRYLLMYLFLPIK
jgi:hypothetical protein